MEEKIKVVISGCCGRMGKVVLEDIKSREDMVVVAGINYTYCPVENLNVFTYDSFNVDHDVIIDFSHKNNLDSLLRIAGDFNSKLVICTTGYSDEQIEKIKEFAESHAVFLSSNTSIGINLLIKLSKLAREVLCEDFDIEIIEKHHNKKVDAPSGTALTIADALSDQNTSLVFDRSRLHRSRTKNEIGICSVRGGGIKGEHEVLFISNDEVLAIRHTAYSRNIFSKGALDAVEFIMGKQNGLYNQII